METFTDGLMLDQAPSLSGLQFGRQPMLTQNGFKSSATKASVGSPLKISKSGERVLFLSTGTFSFRETPVYEGPAAGFTQSWTR